MPFTGPLARQVTCLIALRACLYLGAMASYFIGIMGTLTFTLGQGVVESACAVGLLNFAQMAGNAWGGSLIDRRGVRAHLRIAIALIVACGIAFQPLSATPAGVLAGAAIFGFALGFADLVARSYPAYLTGRPDELKRINAILMLVGNVSIVVGPLIGGVIALALPTATVFLFMAACAALAVVPARWFRPLCAPRTAGDAAESGDLDPLAAAADRGNPVAQGFSAIFSSGTLTLLFWSTMLAFVGFGAFDPLESLYYRDVLRVGAEWLGWLSSAVGVGGVVGTVLAGAVPARHITVRTLLGVLTMLGASCVLYVATSSPWVAMAGQLCVGVFNGAFMPIKDTLVQMNAPLSHIGRVSAAMTIGYNMGGVIPLLCAPLLASVFGVQGTLLGASCAVTAVPAAILVARAGRSVGKRGGSGSGGSGAER